MQDPEAGFREIEHTADWELEVWAPDMADLLEQAAHGMYALAGIHLRPGKREEKYIKLIGVDRENLLVKFLSELLFLAEQENLAFDGFDLRLEGNNLDARLKGGAVAGQHKEIKAVTYHNLVIRHVDHGLVVNLVFDV